MLRKILVPLDGSALSEQVLPVVEQLLTGCETEVTLFKVEREPAGTVRGPGPIGGIVIGPTGSGVAAGAPVYAETKDQAVERQEREALAYLRSAGKPLAESTGCSLRAVVHFGDPAREIVAFAREGGFDLIAMTTHGRSGLRAVVQGSVTEEVLRSGVAPVLAVRPKEG